MTAHRSIWRAALAALCLSSLSACVVAPVAWMASGVGLVIESSGSLVETAPRTWAIIQSTSIGVL